MKKETKKKVEKKQVIEIHIYVHQAPVFQPQPQQPFVNPPYYLTCTANSATLNS